MHDVTRESCEWADSGGLVPLRSENVHNERSAGQMIMALEGITGEDKCVLCLILDAVTGKRGRA